MERWILKNANINTEYIAKKLNINEVLCKILINRDLNRYSSIINFIKTDLDKLHNPRLYKDMEKGVSIIKNSILMNKRIRIVGDYDVDGIISTYILYKGLLKFGANVDYIIPHRILDGYGINNDIINKAKIDGIDTMITCDNGISSFEQAQLLKKLNIEFIITDHHNISFIEDDDKNRKMLIPDADAIIDSKQEDCQYPFKDLCGAGVAFKFIQCLYEEMGFKKEEANYLIEYVAIATICDVVKLIDENRIFVKEGLRLINKSSNIGLKALINVIGLKDKKIDVYHLGFIIGPCFNASGRLDYAQKGIELLTNEDPSLANKLAEELYNLNNERKEMTVKGFTEICNEIEEKQLYKYKILVIYNKNIHESIAGIIAGKVRERYNAPAIILTDSLNIIKGSGRSIEEYNMFEELLKCKDLLLKFGGHPMAAGLSLESKNIELLTNKLNNNTTLSHEDMIPKVYIDMHMPLDNIDINLAEELKLLEPYGKGNSKPLFAEKSIKLLKANIFGANSKVLKLNLLSNKGKVYNGIYFGNIDKFNEYIKNKFGEVEFNNLFKGVKNNIIIDLVYTIDINEYMDNKILQIIIQYFR